MYWGSFLVGMLVASPVAAFVGLAFGRLLESGGVCPERSLRVILAQLEKKRILEFHLIVESHGDDNDDDDDGDQYLGNGPTTEDYTPQEAWRNN